jgi:hypothetical protein
MAVLVSEARWSRLNAALREGAASVACFEAARVD